MSDCGLLLLGVSGFTTAGGGGGTDKLQMETGDYILLETGDKILLE